AEDGIRDWSVTGVQTCALPIWQLVRLGGFYMGGRNAGLSFAAGGQEEDFFALTEGAHGLLELSFALRDEKGALVAAMRNNVFTEIGRASCRGREEIWVGAV